MPLTHERTFRVRHYECDMYGHVNNTNYLRYMQETAFDASAAAGYDTARYAAMGRQWLVRENNIDYLRPLRYGDVVRVKTWVADFRRVRSRRMYELWNENTGELAARAHTDWVFLDAATGGPATIPREMVAAFFPEGAPDSAPPRDRFPDPPPPPERPFTIRRRVVWQDIDPAGHVNNAMYLSYVEECGTQILPVYGWSAERMAAAGFAIIVRQHRIEYLQQALPDDELEVTTWVFDMKRATGMRHYAITRTGDGALLARVRSLYVWVNPATGQPARVPEYFLKDFAPNIVSSD
jgi:acyl-CoA thioester hydrolase